MLNDFTNTTRTLLQKPLYAYFYSLSLSNALPSYSMQIFGLFLVFVISISAAMNITIKVMFIAVLFVKTIQDKS